MNYKPGPENEVSDNLSRFLIESSEYSDQFSKTISDEEVKAMFNRSINQSQNGETWIPVIDNINCSASSSGNNLLFDEGDTTITIHIKDIVRSG